MSLINRFIMNKPAEKRIAYFYGMVTVDEQVWLLRDRTGDLILIEGEEDYPFLLPVWPSRSFAEMMAAKIEEPCEAFHMPLSVFINELLADMEKDGTAVTIFPNDRDSIMQTREEILEILHNMEQ